MSPGAMNGGDRYSAKLRTPFAVLGIRTDGHAVTEVRYLPLRERGQRPLDRVSARAVAEIERYLADPMHRIDVPVASRGTPFQRRVWSAVASIPLGESRTYGEIARSVRSSPRAVGQACGANPLALVVPCHRVVAAKGALGGFMRNAEQRQPVSSRREDAKPGTDDAPTRIKRWLLAHEGYRFGRM